MTNAHDTNE